MGPVVQARGRTGLRGAELRRKPKFVSALSHLQRQAVFAPANVEDGAVGPRAQAPHHAQGLENLLWSEVAAGGSVLGDGHAAAQMTPLGGAS